MKFNSCSLKKIGKGVTKNRENFLILMEKNPKSIQLGYYLVEKR